MTKSLRISAAALVAAAGARTAFADGLSSLASSDATQVLPAIIRWHGVVASVFVVLFAWIAIRFSERLLSTFGATFTHRRLLFQQIQSLLRFFIYLVAAVLILFLSVQMSREAIAVLGGTAAVAVGFAMKDVVASLVAGIVIIFDRPFRLGDRVSCMDYYGDITQIGLRSVKLLTLDGNVVTIPNSLFTNNATSCGNYGVLHMKLFVDFYVHPDSDIRRACAIVREAAAVSPYTYLAQPIQVAVAELVVGDGVGVRIRLAAYVADTKHEKDFETDVSLRVLTAFREAGIAAPARMHDETPADTAADEPV